MVEPKATQDLLRLGVAAAKAGDKAGARALLLEAARADPHTEMTWLWLASVAVVSEEAIAHLERVLTINPFNQHARAWMMKIRNRVWLEQQSSHPTGNNLPKDSEALEPGPESFRAAWRCPICEQSFLVKPIRCVRCRSVQSLADLWAFFEEVDVDSELLQAAIERWQNDRTRAPSWRHRTLGLALLNLQRYRQALIHLSAAAALSPQDPLLSQIAYELMRRLNRAQDRPVDRDLDATPDSYPHPA